MPDTEKALGLSVLSTIRDWVKSLNSALTTQEVEDAVDAAFVTRYELTAGSGITFWATISGSTPPQTVSDQITEAAEGTIVYMLYYPPAMGEVVVKEQSTQTAITITSVGYTEGGSEISEFTMPADDVVATIQSVP